jgi:hypothetical protein
MRGWRTWHSAHARDEMGACLAACSSCRRQAGPSEGAASVATTPRRSPVRLARPARGQAAGTRWSWRPCHMRCGQATIHAGSPWSACYCTTSSSMQDASSARTISSHWATARLRTALPVPLPRPARSPRGLRLHSLLPRSCGADPLFIPRPANHESSLSTVGDTRAPPSQQERRRRSCVP